MKLENKDFWNSQVIIKTQDQQKTSSTGFERYLFNKVKDAIQVDKIKIFGCGTGREINEIVKVFGEKEIIASDISENMIEQCDQNIQKWGLKNVKTLALDAKDFTYSLDEFNLITIMNNMLTYVTNKEERDIIFTNSYLALKDNGCIIGTMHNQEGVFKKTLYFKIRRLFGFIIGKNNIGIRYSGFKGLKLKAYYFTKNEVIEHLEKANFKNIEVLSLEEYYKKTELKYDRATGYNHIIFFGQK